MKIRTQEDIEALDERIQQELDIDVKLYRVPEVAESLLTLLTFPKNLFGWTIKPIILSVLVYLSGFFIVDLFHVQYLIYAIVGLFVFVLTGLLYGLLILTLNIKTDLWSVINYSLEMMKAAVLDLKRVNNQITKENRKEVLSLLFQGIMHVVIIPMQVQVVSNAVPYFGGMAARFSRRILWLFTDRIRFDEDFITEPENEEDDEHSKLIKVYISTIETTAKGYNKVLDVAFNIARFPIRLAFTISTLLLLLFLYSIW